jgi:hypothetical protein
MRWTGNVSRMEVMRNSHGILVGKPEEKEPVRRPRPTWENNFKMDLREIGSALAQDRDLW